MNGVLLSTLLTQCAPERDIVTQEQGSNETIYEPRSGTMTEEYIIESGDTLSKICRKYGNVFSVEDLQRANNLHSDRIQV